ncbi:Anti-sigma-K factor RskA [Chitinophaga rupis]|uniref:Anti-sigma-K factor RskA n=1 Tax=Chitinophaga rupis TaxID=573321 RepID=A0A1H7WG87_9BACT|nr:anti-sigma factor [Chitinophaga rupis]SEM20490.1 Anti-sigma-K factor RskA [Chitinophaga rupis]
MDVQRYISSGIIESYVVGLLPTQEAREVEQAIGLYPEVKAAVEACRQDMERYVQLHAITPPKGIRKRLMEVIENEDSPEGETLLPEELRDPVLEEDAPSAGFKLSIPRERIWQYALVLAVVLLIISLVMNVRYANRHKALKQQHEELISTHNKATADHQSLQSKLQHTEQELLLLKDPAFKWIRLSGNSKHAGQFATICWNPQSKEVYLLAQSLPEPAADQQYQLWAMVNGKPVDAGVFEMGPQRTALQKMKDLAAAQVFFITLEKKGGNASPTPDQLFVSGKVNG